MIYNSLDIIPYKLFLKITETNDFKLLSDEKEKDFESLKSTWEILYYEHLKRNQTSESKKIFKLSKTIDELIALNKVVILGCGCLKFEYDQEIVNIIISYGYKLSVDDTENYHKDLDRITREANAYIVKSEYYKGMLPEPKKETGSSEEFTADDLMASYCAILGFNIGDFNTVTYMAFFGFQKQVNAKIKSINQNKKSNGK